MTSSPRPPSDDRVAFWLYAGHLWTVVGIALSNFFFGGMIIATALAARGRGLPWRRWRPILLPVGLYAACVIAAIALSRDPVASLRGGGQVLGLATLVAGLVVLRCEERVRRVVDGLTAVAALCAAYGIVQLLFLGYGDINHRIRGPFSHYMTFAGFLLMADLMLIGLMVCGRHRNLFRWVSLVMINLALLASLTRSAWVAFAIALTLCLAIRRPRWVWAYVPAVLVFLTLAPVPVVHRVVSIFDLKDVSNYDRICMAEAGLLMVRDRPLTGLGPGMVREVYPVYRHPTAPRRWVPHLHNNVVHVAAEEGVPAMLAFLWLMGSSIVVAYRGYQREEHGEGRVPGFYLGALLALVGFNLAGVFEYNWGDTEVQRIALALAALPWALATRPDGGGWRLPDAGDG